MKTKPKEDGDEEAAGRKGFSRDGFIYAGLGTSETLVGDLESEIRWRGPKIQIGTLRIKGLTAIVETPHQEARVSLRNSTEMREIRSRVQSIEGGATPIARVWQTKGADQDERAVDIEFIFASEQRHLGAPPYIFVPPEIAKQAAWAGDASKFSSELLGSLSHKVGKGVVMFVKPRSFFGTNSEDENGSIELLNSSGDSVICRIVRYNSGGFLVVTEYQPRERNNQPNNKQSRYWKEQRLRIFGFDGPPEQYKDSTAGPLSALEALVEKRSTFLTCWNKYRMLVGSANAELHDQRLETDLSFHAGSVDREDPGCHHVRIANWRDARQEWGETKDLDVFVGSETPDLAEGEKRIKATLLSVDNDGDARLRWGAAVPISRGVIRIGDRSAANDHRVAEAAWRLEEGNTAMPNLRELLNAPGNAEPPKKLNLRSTDSNQFDESQREAITKALGNRSIVAIQGPPGTGKTRVIVATIKEFYKRHKERDDEGFQGNFRVLISSAQNVAVFNAIDILAKEGILIDQRLSATASSDAENAHRIDEIAAAGREISQRIEGRFEREPQLQFHAEQTKASRRMLRELREWQGGGESLINIKDLLDGWLIGTRKVPSELIGLVESYRRELDGLNENPATGDHHSPGDRKPLEATLRALLQQMSPREALKLLRCSEDSFDSADCSEDFERLNNELRREARTEQDTVTKTEGATAMIHAILARLEQTDEPMQTGAPALAPNREDELLKILRRLEEELENRLGLLRNQVGGVLDEWRSSLEEEPGLWKKLVEEYALLTGATCQMAAPSSKADLLREAFDLVVVDEAARTDPGELMIPLTLGKRILLVGDQKQLPPFVDNLAARRLKDEDPSYLDLLNEQSFFEELFAAIPGRNKTMLNRQYRSHPMIGNAISRAFYDGLLQSGPEELVARASWQAERTPCWGLCEDHPLCWINTDHADPPSSKTLNPVESELAIGLITKALPRVQGTGKQIGVIAFYQDQVKHLRAQLEQVLPNYSKLLELDTVDSFQGKEFPLVILLTSRFDPKQGKVGFLALPNRINVAVSRAQRQLLIIGSVSTLQHKIGGAPPFKAFASAAGADLHYIAP